MSGIRENRLRNSPLADSTTQEMLLCRQSEGGGGKGGEHSCGRFGPFSEEKPLGKSTRIFLSIFEVCGRDLGRDRQSVFFGNEGFEREPAYFA